MDARQRLIDTYRTTPEIGLVLGAGVSIHSGVPDYATLAIRILELAKEKGLFDDSDGQHQDLLSGCVPAGRMPPPDEILTYARSRIASNDEFHWLVREALYCDVAVPREKEHEQQWPVAERTWTKHRTLATEVYAGNTTLDAVISFCASKPHAGNARWSREAARAATNRHVGAVLTTNYDNLVEASFGTKYRTSLLQPIGRFPIRQQKSKIPVFHCHGYVRIAPPRKQTSPLYSPLLIAEEDYYLASHNTRSFGNTVMARVLRRMPCLFIGSAMTDRNLRRHLLLSESPDLDRGVEPLEHFAALPQGDRFDDLTDAVLERYRVSVIRIEKFSEIPRLLRDLYVAADDTTNDDWEWTQMSFLRRDAVRKAERVAAIGHAAND